jgi:SAM-dependent methyltransferase
MRNDFAADSCIYPLEGSVRELLKGDCSLGQFNFIYAAGLYDYLLEPVAIKLTQRCLSMLRPGGTFLFANFADSIQDAGYMEACMDWALLLRSEVEVRNIASAAVGARGFDVRVQRQGNGNIIYAWIERRKLRRSARGTGRCAPTGSLF